MGISKNSRNDEISPRLYNIREMYKGGCKTCPIQNIRLPSRSTECEPVVRYFANEFNVTKKEAVIPNEPRETDHIFNADGAGDTRRQEDADTAGD